MRIIQIYNALIYGDGVTQCIFNLAKVFDDAHIENILYVCAADEKCKKENVRIFVNIADIELRNDDIIIYHFANGCSLNNDIEHLKAKKILVFQNVTDPDCFRFVDEPAFDACLKGKYEAAHTAGNYIKAITMSEFSKRELIGYGWHPEDVYVIPLIRKIESQSTRNTMEMEDFNILYVGRIAPNKKIDDLLRIFDYYNKHYNPQSQLVLIGKNSYPIYWKYILKILDELNNENIIWRGHVTDEERDMEYKKASIYLSMSEHEGFCMPLMEAMGYDIPVVAYASTAVPDTMGDAGILIYNKDPQYVSKILNELDSEKRKEIISGQRRRLVEFCIERYTTDLLGLIQSVAAIDDYQYRTGDEFFYIENKKGKDKKIKSDYSALDKENEIVIYGCGVYGKKLMALLKAEGYHISAICDNQLDGNEYNGIPVRNVEKCVAHYPRAQYVISSVKNVVSMTESLIAERIDDRQIKVYIGYNDTIF